MPSVSKSQFKWFKHLENDPEAAKEVEIKPETIQDFTKMSKRKWKSLPEMKAPKIK